MDLKKMAIKALLPTITDFLPELDRAVGVYRQEWIARRPIQDGEDIVVVLFFKDEKMWLTVGVTDAGNTIIEQLETLLFSHFVTRLIDTFKNS